MLFLNPLIPKSHQSKNWTNFPNFVITEIMNSSTQRAKKVVSGSPGLVDFAIGLVKSVFNLPDGQVMFFEEFE